MNYRELMIKDLQDLYQAEVEQAKQLPQLAEKAASEALRDAFREHTQDTQQQVMRLREVLEMLGEEPGAEGAVTPGVKGMLLEARKKVDQVPDPGLKDLALIAVAQELEHYEMARYGTVRAMAHTAGLDQAVRLLQTSLDEEKAMDRHLTEIALPIHKQVAQREMPLFC